MTRVTGGIRPALQISGSRLSTFLLTNEDDAMRFLQPALATFLIGVAAPILAAPALAQTCACPPTEASYSGPVIQADEPPPPLPVYEQPPIPAPGYIWTPGYWAWNTYDYYWVPGVWVPPPQPGLLWTPGYWAFVGGAYFFHQGYWGPHVGFYGGVNYGYGYNGLGYEGGRWEANRFVYNTAANTFGGTRIASVYTQAVTAAPGATRASYNGGPGGVTLRPTPEQERLTTEEHVRPTQLQVTQARAASMDAMQFRSANQGKPAVAATARPGDLRGPGASPAKTELTPLSAPPGEQKPPSGASIIERKVPSGASLTPSTPDALQRPGPGERAPSGAPNVELKAPTGATLTPGTSNGLQRPGPGEKPPGTAQPPGEKPTKAEPSALPKTGAIPPPGRRPAAARPSPRASRGPRRGARAATPAR